MRMHTHRLQTTNATVRGISRDAVNVILKHLRAEGLLSSYSTAAAVRWAVVQAARMIEATDDMEKRT